MRDFFEDFDAEAGMFFKKSLRRLWWVVPLNLAIIGLVLAFIAWLIKWVIS